MGERIAKLLSRFHVYACSGSWEHTDACMRARSALECEIARLESVAAAAREYYAKRGTFMSDGENHALGKALAALDADGDQKL